MEGGAHLGLSICYLILFSGFRLVHIALTSHPVNITPDMHSCFAQTQYAQSPIGLVGLRRHSATWTTVSSLGAPKLLKAPQQDRVTHQLSTTGSFVETPLQGLGVDRAHPFCVASKDLLPEPLVVTDI